MKITKIKKGPYKGQYVSEIGVIYNEDLARKKFPEAFKSGTKSTKKVKK